MTPRASSIGELRCGQSRLAPESLNDIYILEKVPARQSDTRPSPATPDEGPAHPDGKRPWKPDALQSWKTVLLGLAFIVLAISSEVILIRSKGDTGQARISSVEVMRLIRPP